MLEQALLIKTAPDGGGEVAQVRLDGIEIGQVLGAVVESDTFYNCAKGQAPSPVRQIQVRRLLPPRGPAASSSTRVSPLIDVRHHTRGWVQQLHLGAMRNNNARARRTLGPDTGWDAIGDLPQALALARFLDRLDAEDQLAKTIVYNLNPADNEVFASIIGTFQDGRVPGKIQLGSAWWFLDQRSGIERQLDALSNLGLLSRFIGMLTDSRSFLSYSRHEYFRRILCNVVGRDVDQGLLPDEPALLDRLIADVCFENVRAYFGFDVQV